MSAAIKIQLQGNIYAQTEKLLNTRSRIYRSILPPTCMYNLYKSYV